MGRMNGHPGPVYSAVLGLLVALTSIGVGAAATHVESTRRGEEVEIYANATLRADIALAWHVLTDYERYVDFIPALHKCRVVSRDREAVVVEQSGDAMLGPLRWPIEVTFVIRESPPGRLESHAVAGSLKALDSTYTLTAASDGTHLVYVGKVTPGFGYLGQIEEMAVRRNVTRQFEALVDEIERRATTLRAAPVGR